MPLSPCCNGPMMRVPSVPSQEVWACCRCGHRYLNNTWADAEYGDDNETYREHWQKIKGAASRRAAVLKNRVQGKTCGD
jgi:hypothetical protein